MPELSFPRDAATLKEWTHPNGERGIMIGFHLPMSDLAAIYDIDGIDDGTPTVMPLKHNADGATNFEDYREENDELIVTQTDEQYEQVRAYLRTHL